jgi:hypothetical protein
MAKNTAKKKKKRTLEAKGSGAKKSGGIVLSEKEATIDQGDSYLVDTITPYDIFSQCIKRARNLIKIHEAAHGNQARPEKYLADAHRAAIVLAVSALDAFIRTFVIGRIRELLADRTSTLPEPLATQITKFLKIEILLEAARKDDLLDRVEKAFRSDFEKRSFQGTKNITECMKMIGFEDVFSDIAVNAGMNEEVLRNDLDKYTERRHQIAHKGDYDLTVRPPKENVVTKKFANDCIKLVILIADTINKLG